MPRYFAVSRHVMHERLDGEVVALDMATGRYFSMSGPAADVWHLVTSGFELSAWPVELASVFATTQVFSGLDSFVTDLISAGLVSSQDVPPSNFDLKRLPNDYARQLWTHPELFSYDDLSDLILIDPIHDISDDGWPTHR